MGLSAPKRSTERQARDAFLARIAREIDELKSRIRAALADPAEVTPRKLLAQKLRTLAVEAVRAGQTQLAEELGGVRTVVQSAGVLTSISDADVQHVESAMARILVYIEAERDREIPATPAPKGPKPTKAEAGTLRLLVIAGAALGEALLAEDWASEDDAPSLVVDQTSDVPSARMEAKRKKPEVIVVDADLEGARALIERLVSDTETESTPLVVLGKWDKAEDAAVYIALGVARTLAKPVSPGALRRACLGAAPSDKTAIEPLGELTLDGLGARLADELHRGLCDTAEDRMRRKLVDLGQGGEVLTVLWEAVGRIRELVTAQSKGTLRFQGNRILDALPNASLMAGVQRRTLLDRAPATQEVRTGQVDKPLDGFRICVAEDDLSTNWFLCGVLREHGADVQGHFNGHKALDHAYRQLPDLLVADIVMPELDGYALCRAIKRDVLMRSVPVLLLSWKPDLLQRVRELGAAADGYLLKEASGKEIVQRVQELLRPRRAIAERIAAPGAVRGRLDGLTVPALLKLVCHLRPMCRLSIRDARFLYEVELRGGRPVLATATGDDGATVRGPEVLASLVGVGAGRFSIADIDEGTPLRVELEGSLDEQLIEPIARARAGQRLLSGTALMRVLRVAISENKLGVRVAAMPEPARSLLRAIISGACPRDLICEGRAPAELSELVLCDAARQGAVASVIGGAGEDLLSPAIEREMAVLSGQAEPVIDRVPLGADAFAGLVIMDDEPPALDPSEDVSYASPVELMEAELVGTPRTPMMASAFDARGTDRDTPLLARVVDAPPCFAELDESDEPEEASPIDSIEQTPTAKPKLKRRRKKKRVERARYARLDASPSPAPRRPEPSAPPDRTGVEHVAQYPRVDPRLDPRAQQAAFSVTMSDPDPRLPRVPMPSAWATRGADPPSSKSSLRWVVPLVFGLLGIGLAIGARWMRERQPMQPPAAVVPAPMGLPPPGPMEIAPPQQRAEPQPQPEPSAVPNEVPVELALSKEDKAKLKQGEGILEIVVGRNDQVFVDGKAAGSGPVVSSTVMGSDEPHEVRVKLRGEERVRYVVVKAGKRLRLRIAPPWSR